MKLGLILECGPEGADKKVCEYLAQKLKPEIEVVSITLDNKPGLLENCGESAAQLLNDGCEKVVIVWDLYPPWREDGEKPCRQEDRENIFSKLTEAEVNLDKVFLVCIREELEAWLIADGRTVSEVLSTQTRRIKIGDEKRPEQIRNPKMKLNKHFTQNRGIPYSDLIHAERIVKAISDFSRLRRSESFVRFALKATDTEL
jgi:hypothetical protein